jgi:hypothetical protein
MRKKIPAGVGEADVRVRGEFSLLHRRLQTLGFEIQIGDVRVRGVCSTDDYRYWI